MGDGEGYCYAVVPAFIDLPHVECPIPKHV